MKTTLLLSLIFFASSVYSQSDLNQRIRFATIEEAKEMLTTEDLFTQSWSPFDIDSRMHKPGSSKEKLYTYIKEQTRAWTGEEKTRIGTLLTSLDSLISSQGMTLDLPDEIYLLKTTMAEEGGAGAYTRGGYIVLGEQLSSLPDTDFKHVFLHELFHVLSRNNESLRSSMYKIFGFEIINNIDYPESIRALRITNPDAPQTDHFIRLMREGKEIECMMILYSKKEYTEGDFFDYLQIGFLQLDGETNKSIAYEAGNPIIYTMGELSQFFEQIGKNTNYIIHPEEISAENFASAILNQADLPNPEIADKIRALLK